MPSAASGMQGGSGGVLVQDLQGQSARRGRTELLDSKAIDLGKLRECSGTNWLDWIFGFQAYLVMIRLFTQAELESALTSTTPLKLQETSIEYQEKAPQL